MGHSVNDFVEQIEQEYEHLNTKLWTKSTNNPGSLHMAI